MKEIVAVVALAVVGVAFGADMCKEHDPDRAHDHEHEHAHGRARAWTCRGACAGRGSSGECCGGAADRRRPPRPSRSSRAMPFRRRLSTRYVIAITRPMPVCR